MTTRLNLSQRIAQRIVQQALSERWPNLFHLVKKSLAEQFAVSRTPVQQALESLEAAGLVQQDRNRGYFLTASADELSAYLIAQETPAEPSDPQRIIADRMSGLLSDMPSEQELMRGYGWNKARLANALRELASAGLMERKAGYGWQFQPLVTGLNTQRHSYEFRRIIECAALASPDYQIDQGPLKELRDEQQWLLDGGFAKVTHVEMFEIGSRFHEGLVSLSGNPYYLDALRRANRLRSFYEQSAGLRPVLFERHCREHIEIIDRLLEGDRDKAIALLQGHLNNVHQMKVERRGQAQSASVLGHTELLIHF